MESISFHRGNQKRFSRLEHFVSASGDNAKECYHLYQNYYGKIETKCNKLRREYYQRMIDQIRSCHSAGNLIQMTAIVFSDSAFPAKRGFFDDLQAKMAKDYQIARLDSGSSYSGVESLIDSIGQQIANVAYGSNIQELLNSIKTKKPILIIMEDIQSFDTQTLDDFFQILSRNNSAESPFIIMPGFREPNSPNSILSHKIMGKFVFEIVRISMDSVISDLLEFLLTNIDIQFTPKSFKLLASAAKNRGMTCDKMLFIIRLCFLEHFRSTESSSKKRKKIDNSDGEISSVVDDSNVRYRIGLKIMEKLALRSESGQPRDMVSLVCQIADETFLDWDSNGELFNVIKEMDTNEITQIIQDIEDIIDTECKVESNTIEEFRKNLENLKNPNWKPQRQPMNRRGASHNPHRSTKLMKLSENIQNQKSVAIDVLELKKRELGKLLKVFFTDAFDRLSAPVFFVDVDFLRGLLSTSSREILLEALSEKFHSTYDFYENAGPNIDLANWFEEFKMGLPDDGNANENDHSDLAKFYKLLSEFEYTGLIKKGSKKNFAMKLCWASSSMDSIGS